MPARPPFTANNLTTIVQQGTNSGDMVSSLLVEATNTNGISITAFNNGSSPGGTWQYSTNSGGSWNALPSLGGQAFVLSMSDLIRFAPNNLFTGTSASITFMAWNGAGASDASLTTTNATNFSSTSVSSMIEVDPPAAPTLTDSNGGTSVAIQDDQTVNPFNNSSVNITINESDSSDLLTVTVTQELSNGSTDSTLANGLLTGAGFISDGHGVYILTGVDAATATNDLQALLFTPTRRTPSDTVATKFSLSVTDSYSQNTTFLSEVDTTGNVQPVLNGAEICRPFPRAPPLERSTASWSAI